MLLAVEVGCQSLRSSILAVISVIKRLKDLADPLDPHWAMGSHSLHLLSLSDDLETRVFSIKFRFERRSNIPMYVEP